MKILLIDDHVSFCEGLIAALATIRDDYQVDFESEAEMVPQSLVGRTDYDLYIMDLMMPGLGGIELIKYLNKSRNDTPVMVMSSVRDVAIVRQVFELGAIGYMPKSYSVYQIVDAIEECRGGQVHIPGFLDIDASDTREASSHRGSGIEQNRPESGRGAESDGIRLTKRQLDVMSLMNQGLSNQEIADALFISLATVKTHVNQLFKIFNANNRISCLRAAKKVGLLLAH